MTSRAGTVHIRKEGSESGARTPYGGVFVGQLILEVEKTMSP